jgi:GNAT superfamily N-acetyltransferase
VTPVIVRTARPEDAERLSAIARDAKASWGYPEEWLDRWRDELTFTPAYLEDHQTWVAETGGVAVGVIALEPSLAGMTIDRLWVDPGAQGRGVGRALVAHALATAGAEGTVDVLSDPHAEAFYLKLGFRRAGELPAPMPAAPDRILPRLIFSL